ncbi:MAG: hypothetical protein IT371_30670 [Deltaproteobacteria bacterium]|nr:hypothetical protein [Deltaproteobacteria bacterium]
MAQVSVFTRVAGTSYFRTINETTDQAVLAQIEGTVATRSLWADAAATTVNLGTGTGLTTGNLFTGAALTAVNVGTGMGAGDTLNVGGLNSSTIVGGSLTVTQNLTVNGTTTTINSTTLDVADRFITSAVGGGGNISGGFAVSQANGAGNDFLCMWNDTANRGEVGFGDASTNPASVTSFANWKVNNLLVGGTNIVADAGLTVQATAAALALVATGANSITLTTNGTAAWAVDSNGDLINLAGTPNNIGTTTVADRPDTIYVGTQVVVGTTVTITTNTVSGSAGLTCTSVSGNTTVSSAAGQVLATGATGFSATATTGNATITATAGAAGVSATAGLVSITSGTTTSITGGTGVSATATTGNADLTATAGSATLSGALTTNITSTTANVLLTASSGITATATTNTILIQALASNVSITAGTAVSITSTTSTTIGATTTASLTAGAASDLTLGARGATLTYNDAGNTTLSGTVFSGVTSIVGALNALATATASTDSVEVAYTNANAGTITLGQVTYISATDSVDLAVATADNALARPIGFVQPAAGIASAASGQIAVEGRADARFVAGLTLTPGDEVFLSLTAGSVTDDVSAFTTGNVIQSVGFVKSLTPIGGGSPYDGGANLVAQIQIQWGGKIVL